MIGAHIPTGPGWYWWLADHAADPESDAYPVHVLSSRAGGLVAWLGRDDGGPTPVNETPGEFRAPIPPPAVCAALARYAEALAMPESTRRKIAAEVGLSELYAAILAYVAPGGAE